MRAGQLSESEGMTILMSFPQSHSRTFKAYYTEEVAVHRSRGFPRLVSQPRLVALIPSVLVPLGAYLDTCRGACRGLSFVDWTHAPARFRVHATG